VAIFDDFSLFLRQIFKPMKKVFITLGLLLFAFAARAQWTLQTYGEYDYTRTSGSSGSLALKGDCRMADNFNLGLGFQATTLGRYSLNLQYQIALLRVKSGTLYLENRYLYRLFPSYNLQEFNGVLDLGWRNRHFNFQLGLTNRYTAPIPLRKNGGMDVVFEPMNITFCVEGNLFDQTHPWNVGARFSNYRDFVIERFTLFFYSLNGYYDFGNGLRLTSEVGLHPCGALNLSAQYNGWFGNVGLIWKPKN
jgi:hypothetical protein